MFDTSKCAYCNGKLEKVSDVSQVSPEGEVPILGTNVWLMHKWCKRAFASAVLPRTFRFTDYPVARRAAGVRR